MGSIFTFSDELKLDVKGISYVEKIYDIETPDSIIMPSGKYSYDITLNNGRCITRNGASWKLKRFTRNIDMFNNESKKLSLINITKERDKLIKKWEKYNKD